MIAKVYKNWKQEKGATKEVKLLYFLQYFRTTNGEVLEFQIENEDYIGEVWVARDLSTGKKIKCIVRVQESAIPEFNDFNKEPLIQENQPNPIVDSIEDVFDYLNGETTSYLNRNVRRSVNVQLRDEELKDKAKNIVLRKLLKEVQDPQLKIGIKRLLNFRQSPSLSSMRFWKEVPRNIKKQIKTIIKDVTK